MRAVTLDDKYTTESGRVFLTGVQALTLLPMLAPSGVQDYQKSALAARQKREHLLVELRRVALGA